MAEQVGNIAFKTMLEICIARITELELEVEKLELEVERLQDENRRLDWRW